MAAAPISPGDGLDVEYVPDTAPAPAVAVPQPAPPPPPATITFAGEQFRVAEQGVSLLALMELASIAKMGVDADSMQGIAALYELLQACIAPEEWPRFRARALATGAGGEELMYVVRDAVQAKAARPTQPLSGSPGGRSTTGPSSAAGSSSPDLSGPIRQGDPRVQAQLEARGRPDLALVVQRAREASMQRSPR